MLWFLKKFHPKSLELTDNNNNSCCHTEFKELNCTQWSASVTIFGTVSKQMNCDRIWLDSNKTKSGYLHRLLCQAQVALRGKSWKDTIFKIIVARRTNVSICNLLTSYLHVYCSAQWNYFRNRQSSIDGENILPFEIFPTIFHILRETSFDIIFKKFALTKKGITILL